MNEGYVKLFNSILISSVWQEDDATRLLWIAMLALADKNGHVTGSVPGLAHVARIPVPSCQKALAILSAPDPDSQNPVNEGRRIAAAERGWIVLNYKDWRKRLSAEDRREYKRLKQQEYRDKEAEVSTLSTSGRSDTMAEADSRVQSTKKGDTPFKPPSVADGLAYAKEIGWSQKEFEGWYDHFQSNGWKVGGKAPMKDWKAAMRNGARRHAPKSEAPASTGSSDAYRLKKMEKEAAARSAYFKRSEELAELRKQDQLKQAQ